MNFNKLKGLMVEKGYTQKTLANELGVTTKTLNAKLNNKTSMTLEEALKICHILKVDNPVEIFFTPSVPNLQRKDP